MKDDDVCRTDDAGACTEVERFVLIKNRRDKVKMREDNEKLEKVNKNKSKKTRIPEVGSRPRSLRRLSYMHTSTERPARSSSSCRSISSKSIASAR